MLASLLDRTNKDYVVKILEKCDFHAKIEIQNLIDRCLLTIHQDDVLGMHRLIQEMGWKIIHQESNEAGECSRLWHHGDAFSILKNETGTKIVEGLALDMHLLKATGNHAKKRSYEEFIDAIVKACQLTKVMLFLSNTLRSPNDIYLRIDAFKNMTKLRLLKLYYVQLTGSYENFPKSLILFSWKEFPLKSIPDEFPLENLVALKLHHSILEQVWKETTV
ncbi:hypothetical protein LguiA_007522 [Lonicera macranthoides]